MQSIEKGFGWKEEKTQTKAKDKKEERKREKEKNKEKNKEKKRKREKEMNNKKMKSGCDSWIVKIELKMEHVGQWKRLIPCRAKKLQQEVIVVEDEEG